MDEQQIRAWLDENNQKLIKEIECSIPVKFTRWEKDYFACQVHKDDNGENFEVEVFYKEPLEQAKIAHELLHAKTCLTFGDNVIMFTIENQTVPFRYMMKGENASNILNTCEHNMFFPDYLDMGYKEEDSFEESNDLEKRYQELDKLSRSGLKKDGHYDSQRVFEYLGLAFSFLFYPNDKRFAKQVKQLRKIDITLFSRLNKLKRDCSNITITPDNKEFVQEAYLNFANEINKWFSKAFEGAVFTNL